MSRPKRPAPYDSLERQQAAMDEARAWQQLRWRRMEFERREQIQDEAAARMGLLPDGFRP